MHRQFITYQGKPLVVGEEDDLLTIPEPGIEVNEILGSEEVTEKIAEDVQVGDFLYKSFQGFKRNASQPPMLNNPYSPRFYTHNGTLYCYVSNSNGTVQSVTYAYRNSRWEMADHAYGPYPSIGKAKGLSSPLRNTSKGFLSTTGAAIAENSFTVGFNGYGHEIIRVDPHTGATVLPMSVSSVDEFKDTRRDGTYSTGYQADVIEFENEIHFARVINTSGSTESSFDAHIYDTETGVLTRSSYDLSSKLGHTAEGYNRSVHFFIMEGDLYVIACHYSNQNHLYKWDSTERHWYYQQNIPQLGSELHSVFHLSGSTGHWLGSADNRIEYPQVVKYNTSTSSFEEPVDMSVSGSAGGTHRDVLMFEDDGYVYSLILGGEGGTFPYNLGNSYLSKINPTTSSFEKLENWAELRIPSYYGYNLMQGDIVVHENEIHLVINCQRGAPFLFFLKWDRATQKFIRNDFWTMFPTEHPRGSVGAMDMIEFSGTTYISHGSYNTIKWSTSKYITSGDPSGYFLNMNAPDVQMPRRYTHTAFYIVSGDLYAFVEHENPSTVPYVYKLDTSADQFKKIADSEVGIAAHGYCYSLKHATYSGVEFFALAHSYSPYLNTYRTDGSSLSSLPTPPDLTSTVDEVHLIYHDNELFLFAGVPSYVPFHAWKWDTSGWSSLDISGCRNQRHNVVPYVLSGSLYALSIEWDDYRAIQVLKYDGSSSFIPEPTERPLKQVGYRTENRRTGSIVVNDHVYIFIGLADKESICLVRFPEGKWKPFRISSQSSTSNQLYFNPFSVNGNLVCYFNENDNDRTYMQLHGVIERSEFFDEYVWKKREDLVAMDSYNLTASEAYGIALESGSKGDTIRIQKVRR